LDIKSENTVLMEIKMKHVLLITLFVVAAFIAGDYVQLIQTSEAGWGGGSAGTGGSKGGSAKRGAKKGTVEEPIEEEVARVVLEWEEAQIDYPVNDDVAKSKAKPVIKQFEKSYDEQKPVIIFVYTDDMRKKYEAKRNACEKYMNDVLCDPDVAEQLDGYIRIKMSISKLEDSKLRSAYKLSNKAPMIAIYDFTNKQYTKTSNADLVYITAKLKGCMKVNEKAIEKLEKKNR